MGRAKGETHQIAGPHLKLTRPRNSTPLLRSPPTHRAQVRSYTTPDTPRRRYAPNTPRHITRNENPSPHDLLQRLPLRRSEEHTSELQSLMRISYAAFCLNQKKLSLHCSQSILTRFIVLPVYHLQHLINTYSQPP